MKKVTAAELAEERRAARTDNEIIRAEARIAWAKRHDGAECPPARIPNSKDLVAWESEWPADVMAECARRLADIMIPPAQFDIPAVLEKPLLFKWESYRGGFIVAAGSASWLDSSGDETTFFTLWALSQVNNTWFELPEPRPSHPLIPLVDAWQRLAVVSATPRLLVKRASLPRLSKLGADEAALPGFPQSEAPLAGDQLLFDLPDFGPLVRGCPSWLLWLFDRAGGQSLSAGHGAPWDLALFVFALLHLDVADRDGTWRTLEVATLANDAKRMQDATGRPWPSAEAWLFGDSGWANLRRDWDKLPEALERMTKLAYLPIPGIGRVSVLFPSVIPSVRSDPLIQFTIRIPRIAATGDRLNWRRLTEYRRHSARMFRAYLSVVAWFGRSARAGHPITRMIAAPVLGPDGKPRRRKGGAIIRSATERTLNPAERYVAPLSEVDLTSMIGFDPTDRNHRRYARLAFERMEADEVIEIVRDGAGWRLFAGPNW